jgi:hypothetical protein
MYGSKPMSLGTCKLFIKEGLIALQSGKKLVVDRSKVSRSAWQDMASVLCSVQWRELDCLGTHALHMSFSWPWLYKQLLFLCIVAFVYTQSKSQPNMYIIVLHYSSNSLSLGVALAAAIDSLYAWDNYVKNLCNYLFSNFLILFPLFSQFSAIILSSYSWCYTVT